MRALPPPARALPRAWRARRSARSATRSTGAGRCRASATRPRALLLVGLAPAAHGANRTGRVFTGDGVGGSGDFLMSALHRTGFANIPTSQRTDDGLQLRDAYILAAVRCAPPDNKPTPEEIARCLDHLDAEVDALPDVRVVVALGKIAFDAWLQRLKRRGVTIAPRPQFGHGSIARIDGAPDARGLLSPEPAEHEHREADGAHDGGRLPERSPL